AVAIGMNQLNEFGMAAGLLIAAASACMVQTWRWVPEHGTSKELFAVKFFFTALTAGVLGCGLLIDNYQRNGRPWTQLPDAIAYFKSELYLEQVPLKYRNWPPPPPPPEPQRTEHATALSRKLERPD